MNQLWAMEAAAAMETRKRTRLPTAPWKTLRVSHKLPQPASTHRSTISRSFGEQLRKRRTRMHQDRTRRSESIPRVPLLSPRHRSSTHVSCQENHPSEILTAPPGVAAFETFLPGRFWVFGGNHAVMLSPTPAGPGSSPLPRRWRGVGRDLEGLGPTPRSSRAPLLRPDTSRRSAAASPCRAPTAPARWC